MAFLMGKEREELKQRMTEIIAAEKETVKQLKNNTEALKNQTEALNKLAAKIENHMQIMQQIVSKL